MDLQHVAYATEGSKRAAAARHPAGWQWVTNLDESGRVYSEGWEFKAPAVPYEKGLSQLRPFVQRLLKSPKHSASLGLFAMDDQRGIHILRLDREIIFFTDFESGQVEVEQRARELLTGFKLAISNDYLDDDRNRHIDWKLPADEDQIVEVASEYAQKIQGIRPSDKLNVSFDEEDEDDQNMEANVFVTTYPIVDNSAPPPENPGVRKR